MALSDSNRATSSSDLFKFPPLTSRPQLFVFYTYYGVAVNGDIRSVLYMYVYVLYTYSDFCNLITVEYFTVYHRLIAHVQI